MTRLPAVAMLTLCALVAAPPAQVNTDGRATVIDGDTIPMRGGRIWLDAINTPEIAQPRTLTAGNHPGNLSGPTPPFQRLEQ